MAEENKEDTIEISEISVPEPTAFATNGLLPQEIEMAEKHGLVEKVDETSKEEKEDGEHKVEPEPETKDSEEEEEEVAHTFEDIEKDENKLKKFNANEQALYWKYKSDKKKRQQAQRDYEEEHAQRELDQVKHQAREIKLRKISEALKSDNLTVEALQSIIGDERPEEDNTPVTKAELLRIESEKETKSKEQEKINQRYAERIKTAEDIGKTKYDNFEELTTLANEVVSNDKTGTYKDVLQAVFSDTEVDEDELVERVVTIAKLNPNYGKKKSVGDKMEPTEKTDVARAIKNSKKKISSASVGSSGSKRIISYDDLTAEDALNLDSTQWQKVPRWKKDELLGKPK